MKIYIKWKHKDQWYADYQGTEYWDKYNNAAFWCNNLILSR